ncbi:DEKNAAC101351 [Brettanomyces naardenensis]|uniref:ER lumen protein-retaining receptor n=1 Tax=Brettanomyces naardenensis TaxID=13370 RepID=A0A448YHS5_BRENA|nr:DEKNAAC101351 [Brettanomyces naardenensis]
MAGDMSHLISILILIHTIQKKQSAKGISMKTQILYAVVFITRYLDLLTFSFVSVYNTLMKIFFIASSIYAIVLLKKYSKEIKADLDNFPIHYLIIPSFVLSLIFNYKFSFLEILWSFSLWLESVAILPQLFLLQSEGESELLTIHYIFALGIYRALYIPNWLYRYFSEGRFDALSVTTGLIQTLVYSDFFYVYYKKVLKNGLFSLPH